MTGQTVYIVMLFSLLYVVVQRGGASLVVCVLKCGLYCSVQCTMCKWCMYCTVQRVNCMGGCNLSQNGTGNITNFANGKIVCCLKAANRSPRDKCNIVYIFVCLFAMQVKCSVSWFPFYVGMLWMSHGCLRSLRNLSAAFYTMRNLQQ